MPTQNPSVPPILRVALYLRVSSEEQAKFGDSMRDQKERGLEYIRGHRHLTLQDIYIDDGVSGQKLERGDFGRLIDNVSAGLIDLIIFTKLDRWFRNLRHYLNIQEILEQHNAAWLAIDQPYFDTSTPHGRAFVAQSMMWAELEAQNDGVRIRDVFSNKVKYGEVITGKTPRGYQIENKHLVLNTESAAVRDSILYFLYHQSLHKTLLYMKEEHGIVMTMNNLKTSILRNEKYTGRYRGNETYCPRLISDEEYHAVQRILDSRCSIKSNQKYPYIFSGLLVCSECGSRMSGCQIHVVSRRTSGKVYRYQYPAYECRRHRTCRTCENGGEIREVKIENFLLDYVRDECSSWDVQFKQKMYEPPDYRPKKDRLRQKKARLKDLYVNELISIEEYRHDLESISTQLCKLDKEESASASPSMPPPIPCGSFDDFYHSFSNEEKRIFWRSVVREVQTSRSIGKKREFKAFFL